MSFFLLWLRWFAVVVIAVASITGLVILLIRRFSKKEPPLPARAPSDVDPYTQLHTSALAYAEQPGVSVMEEAQRHEGVSVRVRVTSDTHLKRRYLENWSLRPEGLAHVILLFLDGAEQPHQIAGLLLPAEGNRLEAFNQKIEELTRTGTQITVIDDDGTARTHRVSSAPPRQRN